MKRFKNGDIVTALLNNRIIHGIIVEVGEKYSVVKHDNFKGEVIKNSDIAKDIN